MSEILEHTIEDSIKLIPFLFLTYLLMEYIEHKTKEKSIRFYQPHQDRKKQKKQ